jgi:hypothetical protein
MDGDDICHPRRLELQASYLESHPDTGLVACNFRHFPRTGLKQGMFDYESWQNGLTGHSLIIRDLYVESPFVHPSIMTRRSIMVHRSAPYRTNSQPHCKTSSRLNFPCGGLSGAAALRAWVRAGRLA